MTALFKLTDELGQTYGGTAWGEGVEHTAPGIGPLCSEGWLHAYTDPLLAVLLNPIDGAFTAPRLWKAEGDIGATEHGLKVGCTRLRTTRELPLPAVTIEQCVRFCLLCTWQVCQDIAWRAWASRWLDGSDRSESAAWAAAWAAESATWVRWATRAVRAASAGPARMTPARVAWGGAGEWAAESAARAWAARAAARAAWARGAAWAAAARLAAAESAKWAALAAETAALDLPALARQAVQP